MLHITLFAITKHHRGRILRNKDIYTEGFSQCLEIARQKGNETHMKGVQAEEKCFFQVCYPDSLKNRDHVELCRQSQARPGDVYPCYFDPDHVTNGAFFHRSIQWSFAFHVLAWPAFSVIGSVSMCIYISYRKHRKSRLKKKNHSASNDARSQALLRTPVANGPSPRIATTV
ncbi:hypothetical protein CAPTEDRAFT_207199 [Capitella teleta]|uniref:Uncharacterized protein n=1 Tax=Capitella teleta TaxID=283909 RepID=R7T6Z7_CAPTE|nr:hypothetical protein CAPTEDRAFT_207199 [Capitella teleta]|eukprot:ELT89325.1 hypothetical protein CAPTEDRAFT_207199 [Capitella teleta]